MTYLQAISDGLRTEMRRDDRVFVIGEDVGVYGGAFKVTSGFQEEFGPWRVIDAPLAESVLFACKTMELLATRFETCMATPALMLLASTRLSTDPTPMTALFEIVNAIGMVLVGGLVNRSVLVPAMSDIDRLETVIAPG